MGSRTTKQNVGCDQQSLLDQGPSPLSSRTIDQQSHRHLPHTGMAHSVKQLVSVPPVDLISLSVKRRQELLSVL